MEYTEIKIMEHEDDYGNRQYTFYEEKIKRNLAYYIIIISAIALLTAILYKHLMTYDVKIVIRNSEIIKKKGKITTHVLDAITTAVKFHRIQEVTIRIKWVAGGGKTRTSGKDKQIMDQVIRNIILN